MPGVGISTILITVLQLAILGAIIYVAVRITFRKTSSSTGRDDALDIARERYARGETSREEFEQLRRDLEQ